MRSVELFPPESIMLFESIPLPSMWGLIRRLPAFLLSKAYPSQKLAKLVYVDLRPRHGSATIYLGEVPTFALWLQIINLSPFDIELDRAGFQLRLGGANVKAVILKKQTIAAGEIATVYLNETINEGQAAQFAKTFISGTTIDLEGDIEFNCKVRPFHKSIGPLDGIHPTVYNLNYYPAR